MTAYKHYTDEQIEYLKEIAYKRTRQEITDMFNAKFNENRTVRSIGSKLSRWKIRTGMQGYTSQYKKGHVPWTTGRKGHMSEENKERMRQNTNRRLPIGSERYRDGGFILLKVADPDIWRPKHIVEWEKHHGEIPDQHVIMFKDGDKDNCHINNLFMVYGAAMRSVARRKLRHDHPDINLATHKLTELDLTIRKLEGKL